MRSSPVSLLAAAALLAACGDDPSLGPVPRQAIVAPDTVLLGDTAQLRVRAPVGTIGWRSLDDSVLVVVEPGAVLPMRVGTGRIAVATDGVERDTVTLTVVARFGREVAAGRTSTCALTQSGQLACWGSSTLLPIRATSYAVWSASAVRPGATFASLDAGGSVMCGLTASEALCWGANDFGQLGTGRRDAGPATIASPAVGPRPVSVVAGGWHACSLDDIGALQCWGDGRFGASGSLDARGLPTPRQVSTRRFVAASAGLAHGCALDTGGVAWCWGQNANLQLGRSTATDAGSLRWASDTVPRPVASGGRYRAVSAGGELTCAVRTAGGVECWGNLLTGMESPAWRRDSMPRSMLPDARDVQAVSAGVLHACALDAEGVAWCWGWNDHGQLGDGTTTFRADPVAVAGGALRFDAIAAGELHTCGHATDGRLYCWGENGYGQLGSGSAADHDMRLVPTAVAFQR